MSEKRPTDNQFVNWWFYEGFCGNNHIWPEDKDEVKSEILDCFCTEISTVRAERIYHKIIKETERLAALYHEKQGF